MIRTILAHHAKSALGSICESLVAKILVRFAPDSDLRADGAALRMCAKRRHLAYSGPGASAPMADASAPSDCHCAVMLGSTFTCMTAGGFHLPVSASGFGP